MSDTRTLTESSIGGLGRANNPYFQECQYDTSTTGETVAVGTLYVSHTQGGSDSVYEISFDRGWTWAYDNETGDGAYPIPANTLIYDIIVRFYWFGTGGYGSSGAHVQVDSWEPVITQFTGTSSIQSGQNGSLYAEFSGAKNNVASIGTTPGGSEVSNQVGSGSTHTVSPTSTTTYYLTVTNVAGQSVSAQVTMVVAPSFSTSGAATPSGLGSLTTKVKLVAAAGVSGAVLAGVLTTGIVLSASAANAASIIPPNITTGIRLQASPSALATATSAVLLTGIPLQASGSSAVAVTPNLSTAIRLVGAPSTSVVVPPPVMTTGIALRAMPVGSPSGTGTMTTAIRLAASGASSPVVSPNLTTGIALQASGSAQAQGTFIPPHADLVVSDGISPAFTSAITTGFNLAASGASSPSGWATLIVPVTQAIQSAMTAQPVGTAVLTTGIALSVQGVSSPQGTASALTDGWAIRGNVVSPTLGGNLTTGIALKGTASVAPSWPALAPLSTIAYLDPVCGWSVPNGTAELRVGAGLQAQGAAFPSGTGALSTTIACSTVSAASFSGSAALTTVQFLSGAPSVTPTGHGNLSTVPQLVVSGANSATLQGALSTCIPLQAQGRAVPDSWDNITTDLRLAAEVHFTPTLTGDLSSRFEVDCTVLEVYPGTARYSSLAPAVGTTSPGAVVQAAEALWQNPNTWTDNVADLSGGIYRLDLSPQPSFRPDLTLPVVWVGPQDTLGYPTQRKKLYHLEFHGQGTALVRAFVDGNMVGPWIIQATDGPSRARRVAFPLGTKGYAVRVEMVGRFVMQHLEIGFDVLGGGRD